MQHGSMFYDELGGQIKLLIIILTQLSKTKANTFGKKA